MKVSTAAEMQSIDRRAIQGDSSDGISSAIARALDELATEWGIEL